MNSQKEQTRFQSGPEAAFRFDRSANGVHISADLNRICQQVSDQVRNAIAEIDFEGIGDEVRRAMTEVAAEVREAMDNFSREQQRAGATRVRVDIEREPAAGAAPAPEQDTLARERTAVLQMVADGRITADQAERLLDALGA